MKKVDLSTLRRRVFGTPSPPPTATSTPLADDHWTPIIRGRAKVRTGAQSILAALRGERARFGRTTS